MTDAEAVAKLETLRKKKRTEVKEGLVQAVMAQAVSFEDKIKRIEMIDLLPEAAPEKEAPKAAPKSRGVLVRPEKKPRPLPPEPTPLVPVPESPVQPALPLVDPGLSELDRVEHYRRRLAKPVLVGGIWLYLFKEYGPMIRFGARTSTLSRGTFPFTLKLSSEVLAFLGKTLKSQVLPSLEQNIPLLLRKSWLYLSKHEYNLLAALRTLVRVSGDVEVIEGDKTGGGVAWDAVIPLMRLFWTAPDLLQKTLTAWDVAGARLGCSDKVRQSGLESIRTLLEARTDTQCLPDALLAVQMLRTRRMMAWDEGAGDSGEYFAKDHFDCSPDIQAEIDRAAEVLVTQLESLGKDSQEILRIRYFLPPEDLLAEFDGNADRTELTLWCQGFLQRANAAFTPLLEGSVTFSEGTQTVLFQNPSLSSPLARLRLLDGHLADSTQPQSPELIGSIARVLMNLGKTLVVVIRNRSQYADPLARAPDLAQPTDPLPFEAAVLDSPVEWAGLTVIEALVKTARICLQAGRLLGETSLDTSLDKEATIPAKADDLFARLGRLVPAARLAEVKARWQAAPALANAKTNS